MTTNIYRLGLSGWYDFKDVPQGYVKIHGLNVGDDIKALAKAKKLCPELDYEIVDAA